MKKKLKNITTTQLAVMVKKGFDDMTERFEGRFDGIDRRFDRIEGRMDGAEGRLDFIESKLDRLEDGQERIIRKLDNVAYHHEVEQLNVRVTALEKKSK